MYLLIALQNGAYELMEWALLRYDMDYISV